MAAFPSSGFPVMFLLLVTFLSSLDVSQQQPLLDSAEQESVYEVLSSINSAISWRTLFPDDLCLSAPHGVVCDYFFEEANSGNLSVSTTLPQTVHVTELSFGYVSDYTPNPPCSPNSTLSSLLFTSFKYLRKLFFFKCFTETPVVLPNISSSSFGGSLEELVFVENPALVGSLSDIVGNFSNMRRLVLTGNGVYGSIPDEIGNLVNMEEMTLSRNHLTGSLPSSLAKLKKLKILDFSQNHFDGNLPVSIGNLSEILKLDLSYNGFIGKIPYSMVNFQSLEFLDLSFNSFGNFGVPLFLGQMPRLREVYLSGNLLGGLIPQIWENLGGISGIGFSDMGLVGKIPASMGVYLRNLCYLRLDNNKLEGKVPEEFALLEFVNEINLENNKLSGRIPFSSKFTAKVGEKLKLKGNSELCIDKDFGSGKKSKKGSLQNLKLCNKSDIPNQVLYKENNFVSSFSSVQVSSSPLGLLILGFLYLLW